LVVARRQRRGEQQPFRDVHLVTAGIERRLAQLASNEPVGEGLALSREQRDAILGFVRARKDEVSDLRIRTYLAWLPPAAVRLGPLFLAPDRGAPGAFNDAFPRSDYSRASREGAAHCLTTFWRWRYEAAGADYPPWLRIKIEKWVATNGASDMLTQEEVARIAEAAQNFRDRAWIWTLFNSGCRPGEIYQLRVGDVVPHDEGYVELRVRREKGSAPEPAPVYEDAVPALLAWLSAHPRASDPNAPLWVGLGGQRVGAVATYRAMYKALESAARRAKITKPVTAYALRRSRLTMLAKDPSISTSILERLAAWVPGSRVARHYVHLSGKDVINALNARYGVMGPAPGEKLTPPRTPSKCGRCKTVNPAGAAFCMTCGGPLSLAAVKQIPEARGTEESIADLLRQPEAVEFLARLLAERERRGERTGARSGAGVALDESQPTGVFRLAQPKLPDSTQRVVSLADAERLIGSGYEFVAPLGADRAMIRSSGSVPTRAGEDPFPAGER
jgi:integrase/recombinase XerD